MDSISQILTEIRGYGSASDPIPKILADIRGGNGGYSDSRQQLWSDIRGTGNSRDSIHQIISDIRGTGNTNDSIPKMLSDIRDMGILTSGDNFESLLNVEKLSLPLNTAIGKKVNVIDWVSAGLSGPHQQLAAASSAITGQFVSLAGITEVNAVYTKRGTSGGKDYYNQLGRSDSTTTYSIAWGNLGGILGTGWEINGAGAVLDYYSLDAVSRPDQVTTWVAINLDQVPTVTSVTTGQLGAGLRIGVDTFVVNGNLNGRNLYLDVLGVASQVEWSGSQWQTHSEDVLNLGNVAFPFLGTPEVMVDRDDIANESNWIPL